MNILIGALIFIIILLAVTLNRTKSKQFDAEIKLREHEFNKQMQDAANKVKEAKLKSQSSKEAYEEAKRAFNSGNSGSESGSKS